jgi:Kdo2-lipid IVA lauroyltransferase/acyltransferase
LVFWNLTNGDALAEKSKILRSLRKLSTLTQRTSAFYLNFQSVAILLRLLGTLPLSWLHALGAVLGRLAYRFHGKTRARQDANFALAAAKLPELKQIPAAQIAEETGKQLFEMPWIWARPWSAIAPQVALDAQSLAVIKAPGAVIFLTPHLGCFEVAGYCVGHERPFTAMYRKPRIVGLDAIMRAGRAKGEVVCVPADLSGVKAMFKALKRGEAVGILPDQTPTAGEGAWVPFFGKSAYTMTLTHALAEKTGARLVMVIGTRLPEGAGYAVRAYEIPTLPAAQIGDEYLPTRTLNEHVEAAIAHNPTQYLWSYNRYKQPGGAPNPPEQVK